MGAFFHKLLAAFMSLVSVTIFLLSPVATRRVRVALGAFPHRFPLLLSKLEEFHF